MLINITHISKIYLPKCTKNRTKIFDFNKNRGTLPK